MVPLDHGLSDPDTSGGVATEDETEAAVEWKVVLFDDDDHTYDYVVEMLCACCDLSRESAFRCAVEVDLCGRTTVFYGTRENCRHRVGRIHAFGADPRLLRSQGSMRAQLQPR